MYDFLKHEVHHFRWIDYFGAGAMMIRIRLVLLKRQAVLVTLICFGGSCRSVNSSQGFMPLGLLSFWMLSWHRQGYWNHDARDLRDQAACKRRTCQHLLPDGPSWVWNMRSSPEKLQPLAAIVICLTIRVGTNSCTTKYLSLCLLGKSCYCEHDPTIHLTTCDEPGKLYACNLSNCSRFKACDVNMKYGNISFGITCP